MRLALALVIGLAGGIASFPAVALAQVPATESAPATAQPALPDPLEAGKQAVSKGDYGTAQQLITAYVKDNPNNADARYLAGNASLGLKQYDDAAQSYLAAIKLQPSLWAAHKNLVIAYAAQEKWSDFDREREVIQKARTSGAAGLSNRDADVIDVLYVGTERYIVRSFAELNGRFKARYNIAHFPRTANRISGSFASPTTSIRLVSRKRTQRKRRPDSAAFRSIPTRPRRPQPTGKATRRRMAPSSFIRTVNPSYETVRTDILLVLQHKVAHMSSTTSGKPATPNQ